MCRNNKRAWQTLEPAVLHWSTRGVVQFKVYYIEWKHDSPPFQIVRCSLGNKSHWWNTKINTSRTTMVDQREPAVIRSQPRQDGEHQIWEHHCHIAADPSLYDVQSRTRRTIQAALAVQFWNGTQLQLIFMSAAMSIRSVYNEHFLSDMTSYFPTTHFGRFLVKFL